jgi:hypothetical protein
VQVSLPQVAPVGNDLIVEVGKDGGRKDKEERRQR